MTKIPTFAFDKITEDADELICRLEHELERPYPGQAMGLYRPKLNEITQLLKDSLEAVKGLKKITLAGKEMVEEANAYGPPSS